MQFNIRYVVPANTRRWPNAGSMMGHRLRRWPSTNPALDQRLVFAEGGGGVVDG